MNFIKYILIFFMFVIIYSAHAQKLNELSIAGSAVIGSGEIVPHDLLDVNMNQAALIAFITDLNVDMDFRPWNGAVKISHPAIGRWNVYVSPGERAIDVHAEGFKPIKVVLSSYGITSLKSGEVYHLELTGKKMIPVIITTNPSGVDIFIDDKLIGTSANKELTFSIGEGVHDIRLQKDDFETIITQIEVKVGNQRFDYTLNEEMDAVVSIITIPPGAVIYINDLKVGVSPVNSFFPAGTYPLKIEKENYDTILENITITDPTEKTYSLEDIRAKLTINTYPNATVFINDDQGHKGGVQDLMLPPQIVKVRIESSKMETINTTIMLDKNATVTKDFFPEIQTGIIMINVIPADAEILLTGDGGEKYQSTGKNTFRDVPIGKYNLTISAKGYQTHTESFNLKEEETFRKQISLSQGTDPQPKTPVSNLKKKSKPYYGSFFDFYLTGTGYSRSYPSYTIIDTFYYQNSYHYNYWIGTTNATYTYKNRFSDGIELIFLAQSHYSHMIEVNTDDDQLISDRHITEWGLYADIETKTKLNGKLNFDFRINYGSYKLVFEDDFGKDENSSSTSTIYTGFSIDGTKDIHLLTPEHNFRQGFFADLLYNAYIFHYNNGHPVNDNPSYIDLSLEYAFLNNHSNYMFVPYTSYERNLKYESDVYILGINYLKDFNEHIQSGISVYHRMTFYANSSSTSQRLNLNISLHYYPTSIVDLHFNYNLANCDSNNNDAYDVNDRLDNTFFLGIGLILGYNK